VTPPVVGVLALQGAFAAHARALEDAGARGREVRLPADLQGLHGLVLPGGESSVMSQLLESSDLFDPIADAIAAGLPVFGTCAGMILLAAQVLDGREDQKCFAAIDAVVRRNAYGRQRDSFEADLEVRDLDRPFHAVFIRAPRLERVGEGVEVLAAHDGYAVLARQRRTLVAAFHPELSHDPRIHERFVAMTREA
jgi:5'-phosphate synthase pdxT subunit